MKRNPDEHNILMTERFVSRKADIELQIFTNLF